MGNLFAEWWSINPVLTIIIIVVAILFIGGILIATFIGVIEGLFGSDSSSGNSISYEEPSQEEIEERKREEKEDQDLRIAQYILYKEYEHEKVLRNAKCGCCVHCIPDYDYENYESYDKCACDGHIITDAEKRGHYCEHFFTC